jgi:glycosyltransferase involved in cell wall biosynthesis
VEDLTALMSPQAETHPSPVAAGSAAAFSSVGLRRLSVVVPAFNEEANVGPFLDELSAVLARIPGCAYEVIVVDDGSVDATPRVAAEKGARVVRHPVNLGNGAAVKRGIREARGDWILLLDGDGQHPPSEIPALWERAGTFDMVVGSRNGSGGPAHRNLANRVYNVLASYVTNRRIPDLTSGFRLVRADALKSFVSLLPNTFSYPTTITLAMLKAGYSVHYHPIRVRPRAGKSKIRLLSDGSRFFLIILRISTFFAPLRVFVPVSAAVFALGVVWYLYTYITEHRFTNMALLLMTQATVLFALGLISEQIAQLRFDRGGEREGRER